MTHKELETELTNQRRRLADLKGLQESNAAERRTQLSRLDNSYENTIAAGNELARLRAILESKIEKLQTEHDASNELHVKYFHRIILVDAYAKRTLNIRKLVRPHNRIRRTDC